ncbi:hypothetical protein BCT30_05100 [Enterovibrio norvegicus]|uniref:hypothetical protein n=1 Tax=Enterovibrio norvegicus TaxID=188144 RepID=UPI000C821188|nr:hypothetical protein [Enterovibrio norvegicus]MCC4800269.1 hypothetical protein [Enterovibrio norvegicus]PMI33550.1 hypothetical protein BCU46_22410 [Enterovibrio norvegicus]PMN44277.1 hypothetical protein BCT30_05100 [Enterovibrio norvegicus]TKF29578.1 hypothetical protein FCV83_20900 [Enterovibrio norvegicus]
MQASELKTVATLVRKIIENVVSESTYVDVELQNFPSGSCEVSSVILGLYLKDKYDINVVQSVGKRPSPDCDYSENNHVWLTVNETVVVDITADQFDDFSSKVFVGRDSAFHDTFEVYDIRPLDFSYLLRRGSEGYGSIYKEVSTRMENKFI